LAARAWQEDPWPWLVNQLYWLLMDAKNICYFIVKLIHPHFLPGKKRVWAVALAKV